MRRAASKKSQIQALDRSQPAELRWVGTWTANAGASATWVRGRCPGSGTPGRPVTGWPVVMVRFCNSQVEPSPLTSVGSIGRSWERWSSGLSPTNGGFDEGTQEHNYSAMITADVEFHRLLVEEAGNPLLVESTGPIWRNVQRVMGEVLYRGDTPAWVWQDHARILDAVEAGDEARGGAGPPPRRARRAADPRRDGGAVHGHR